MLSLETVLSQLPYYQYRNLSAIRSHLNEISSQYRNLHPKLSSMGGMNVLVLSGTIPVRISGNPYNIPFEIQFPSEYPHLGPVCFVRPTPDMYIPPHPYVDPSGRVNVPYLMNWCPTSSLKPLLQAITDVFGQRPPVHSRPAGSALPPNPAPTTINPHNPMLGTPSTMATLPPMGHSMAGTMGPGGYPPQMTMGMSQSPGMGAMGGMGMSAMGTMGYPPSQHPSTGMVPNIPAFGYPPGTSSAGMSMGSMSQPQPQPQPMQPSGPTHAELIAKAHELFQKKYEETYQKSKAEFDDLRQTSQRLCEGRDQISTAVHQYTEEKRLLQHNDAILQAKNQELQQFLAQHQNDPEEADPVQIAEPKDVWARQLIHLTSEISAADDLIYELEQANKRNLSAEQYIKHVREISQDQFRKKALYKKVYALMQQNPRPF
eukprot:gnl/Trimastix_PCT/3364.p1 GENE.gnl/Trimastix_PCT/3364~~gnl/Trimastix_PCT/3364.p1  ORF type:complete len:430 (+),score=46.53 gnl/Trimastix_PCT/3364:74-1363(+)